jgi:predicted ABC-type ATPase
MPPPPVVVVIGGPNGAGKTTVSRDVLAGARGNTNLVNADAIAAGLSGFEPDRAAFAAGRVMLQRLRELSAARVSLAFETTLSSRSFAPWLRGLSRSGYRIDIVYVWLRTPALAVRRVRARVKEGGHGLSEEVIRRRYHRSARNLFNLYLPLATTWRLYDNSAREARLIAHGRRDTPPIILDPSTFHRLRKIADADAKD